MTGTQIIDYYDMIYLSSKNNEREMLWPELPDIKTKARKSCNEELSREFVKENTRQHDKKCIRIV